MACQWLPGRNSGMTELSVDYTRLAGDLTARPAAACVGAALLAAMAERYESQCPHCSLVEFVQSGATYLFDLASAAGAGQEDRTVAAWAVTPVTVARRDVSYQRGFPLPPDPDGVLVDRGHLIPHLSGGEFGPNIFRQHRALNRAGHLRGGGTGRWSGRRPPLLAPSISATSFTKTTPHTPRKSRPGCSAAGD